MSLVWIWTIRIPNSEHTMDYLKHVDLKEWGVFPSHPAEWQKANIAKLREGDDDDDE